MKPIVLKDEKFVSLGGESGTGGFYYEETETCYMNLRGVAYNLGLYSKRNCYVIYRWKQVCDWFYKAYNKLGNPDIGLPLNQAIDKEEGGLVSNYEKDLPIFIPDYIVYEMCTYLPKIHLNFKTNLIKECFEKIKIESIKRREEETKMEKQNVTAINTNEKVSQQVVTLLDGEKAKTYPQMSTFLKEARFQDFKTNGCDYIIHTMSYIDEIYVLTRDVGVLVGLGIIRNDRSSNTYSVRWNNFFSYYSKYCEENKLSYKQTGIDVNIPRIKTNHQSPLELKIPEYLNTKTIFGIANMLDNDIAREFRNDLNNTIIPFFINQSTSEDMNGLRIFGGSGNNIRKNMIQNNSSDPNSVNWFQVEICLQSISRIALFRNISEDDVLSHLYEEIKKHEPNIDSFIEQDEKHELLHTICSYPNLAQLTASLLTHDLYKAATERNKMNKQQQEDLSRFQIDKPLKTVVEFSIPYTKM